MISSPMSTVTMVFVRKVLTETGPTVNSLGTTTDISSDIRIGVGVAKPQPLAPLTTKVLGW